MRADRLLRIMLLLQQHPKLSARELSERLEVSVRTVLRDMEALSAAGVPVYAERGRNGGCVLLPGYRADVSGLTAKEAQALFAWTGRAALTELGLAEALRSAMAKLSSSLPGPLRDGAGALSEAIVVDRRRWFAAAEDVGALPALRHAVVAGRRVRIWYAPASSAQTERRTVDPWGLVEHTGRWYLIGAHRGHARMFRVSRVERVEVLEQAAVKPPELDVGAEWARLRSGLEEAVPSATEVTVRVRPELEHRLRQVSASMLIAGERPTAVPTPPGEWPRLRLRFRVRPTACGVLMAFGDGVEVLDPPDLRAELARLATQIQALYHPR